MLPNPVIGNVPMIQKLGRAELPMFPGTSALWLALSLRAEFLKVRLKILVGPTLVQRKSAARSHCKRYDPLGDGLLRFARLVGLCNEESGGVHVVRNPTMEPKDNRRGKNAGGVSALPTHTLSASLPYQTGKDNVRPHRVQSRRTDAPS